MTTPTLNEHNELTYNFVDDIFHGLLEFVAVYTALLLLLKMSVLFMLLLLLLVVFSVMVAAAATAGVVCLCLGAQVTCTAAAASAAVVVVCVDGGGGGSSGCVCGDVGLAVHLLQEGDEVDVDMVAIWTTSALVAHV